MPHERLVELTYPWTDPNTKTEHSRGAKVNLPDLQARRLIHGGRARQVVPDTEPPTPAPAPEVPASPGPAAAPPATAPVVAATTTEPAAAPSSKKGR